MGDVDRPQARAVDEHEPSEVEDDHGPARRRDRPLEIARSREVQLAVGTQDLLALTDLPFDLERCDLRHGVTSLRARYMWTMVPADLVLIETSSMSVRMIWVPWPRSGPSPGSRQRPVS